MDNLGIVGNGFVGSAIAAGFALHANVMVYDKDMKRATHSLREVMEHCEFVFVSVPTPMKSTENGEIDLTILDDVLKEISDLNTILKNEDSIIVIKSTVIPGTTSRYEEKYPNLNIVFNPEFLTERTARLDFINSSRIILGGRTSLTERLERLYRIRFPYVKIICTDAESAEFIKYMCNCFFAVKVSYMNEMKQMATTRGLDWDHIMSGFLSDGRIGNSHIDVPGHDGMRGFGGKCFPKDINAFMHFFLLSGVNPVMLKAAWDKNLEVREKHDWLHITGAVSKGEKNE
jgi:UDPglucose 6-dehydrogenase